MLLRRSFATIKKGLGQPTLKARADEWISSKWGRRFRIGLLGGTVSAYPVAYLLLHGPLLRYTFDYHHSVTFDLPEHLRQAVEKEIALFREHENRLPRDSKAVIGIQNTLESLDSVADGSLGVRTGACIGLPFYARFQTFDEALDYCKSQLQKINVYGKARDMIWDTPAGRELAETLVLSPMALKFLIMRDLYAQDGYNAYANKALSWATWTAFSSIFTYWFHQKAGICKKTALSFGVAFTLFLIAAIVAHNQWYLLYRFIADTHADSVTSHLSFDYSEGGKEYYWKMLKRNRILRDLLPEGRDVITPAGDLRSVTTKLIVRYDLLKDVGIEDDVVRDSMASDV